MARLELPQGKLDSKKTRGSTFFHTLAKILGLDSLPTKKIMEHADAVHKTDNGDGIPEVYGQIIRPRSD